MKDAYLGTIKGDDLGDYPQYLLEGKVFTGRIPACKHLNKNGFTIPEARFYLKALEEEAGPQKEVSHHLVRVIVTHEFCVNRSNRESAISFALEYIRKKEGLDIELQVDSVVTVYTDGSRTE